jgi:hypothetical protein
MKFSDFILDKIIETDLFNLAFRRKRVLDKCSELSWEICKNIIELCCFEKSDTKEILESINDCLYEIENLKINLRIKLDYRYYYDEIWFKRIDDYRQLKDIAEHIKKREYKDINLKYIDYYDLYSKLCELMKEVSRDIENYDLNNFDYYLEKNNIDYK